MTNPELVRPEWRNGKAYTKTLSDDTVSRSIMTTLVALKDPEAPLKKGTAVVEEEVGEYYPPLIKDLRVIDFGHYWYWFVMLVLCLIFLLCELFSVIQFSHSHVGLETFRNALLVCLVGLTFFLLIYILVALQLHANPKLPRYLSSVPTKFYHSLPVFWVSFFTVILNYFVVSETGYSTSPFLPALLTSSLVALSLPRENSCFVLLLALTGLGVGIYGAIHTSQVPQDTLNEWGGQELATWLNILTFVFSGILVVVLRWIANYRINK